ncbi:MAG: hypothetical protein IKW99_03170 [Bacteroidales bacterium]|nr:hypothetical protein [Bacteroidales bacterium]
MKQTLHIIALIIMGAAFLQGCAKEIEAEISPVETPEQVIGGKTYKMSVVAGKDEIGTRALSLIDRTLNATWAVGEKVSVYKVDGEGSMEMESTEPVFTLTAQESGATTTLSGELPSTYTPTAGSKLRLKFLSGNYDNQKGTLDYIAGNCDFAVADVTISEVGTDGLVTTTAANFVNQQAIVRFSLKKEDGTTPIEVTSLAVTVGGMTYNVTPDEAISDIFVAIPKASQKTVTLSAIGVDGPYTYEKTDISFDNGKYYIIGVKMKRVPLLGDIYYSDGTFSTTLETGKTPIGVIAYIGTDVYSENGVTLRDGITTLQSRGLVLCLNDAGRVPWRREGMTNVTDILHDALVDDTGDLKRSVNVSGYANTKFLAEKSIETVDYPAAYYAWNYTGLAAPSGTTGWFLPSIQQWVKILTALGGLSESGIVWQGWIDSPRNSLHNLEAAMAKAGAYNDLDPYNTALLSSSESTAGVATCIIVNTSGGNVGIQFSYTPKSYSWFVRPVLAF